MSHLTLFQRSLAALVMVIALIGASVVAVRASYGAFADTYELHGMFPRAGQSLVPGSDVQLLGVTVGEVKSIELVDRKVKITMEIEDGVEVPDSVVATVRPKTLFGEKFVEFAFPDGRKGQALQDGDELANVDTALEVEELIAGTVPLFDRVDPQSLATVIHELAVAAKGNGDAIASSLESGAQLASLLAETIDAQTRALDSWARFQKALEPTGESLNAISANSNVALPELNAAERDFERALATLGPLAADLAELLYVYRPDIDAILVDGDNVIRTLVSRRERLSETIHGLYRYAFKFGAAQSPEQLPDGSRLGYFKIFILLEDLEAFVCASLAPTGANSAYLEPVRQALSQSALDCTASFAAAAQKGQGTAPSAAARGEDIAGRIQDGVAEPDQPVSVTLDALVQRVLQGTGS